MGLGCRVSGGEVHKGVGAGLARKASAEWRRVSSVLLENGSRSRCRGRARSGDMVSSTF